MAEGRRRLPCRQHQRAGAHGVLFFQLSVVLVYCIDGADRAAGRAHHADVEPLPAQEPRETGRNAATYVTRFRIIVGTLLTLAYGACMSPAPVSDAEEW